MTTNEFNTVLKETLDIAENILGVKAEDYARGDRLHNFKVAADLAKTTPEMALRGMLTKRIVSVWDLIKDLEQGKCADLEMWDEKIIDCINYFILLRALIIERRFEGDKKSHNKRSGFKEPKAEINLCDSCRSSFPECLVTTKEVEYSKDNKVIKCSYYVPTATKRKNFKSEEDHNK